MTPERGVCEFGLTFRYGNQVIADGRLEVVVVIGAESMTVADNRTFTQALGIAADQATEGPSGLTYAGFYGLFADRYLAEHDATRGTSRPLP
jgi:acetyl-CoA acetyltransferase